MCVGGGGKGVGTRVRESVVVTKAWMVCGVRWSIVGSGVVWV